jgi:hypothetical protein
MCPILHRVSPTALETDLAKRVDYVTKFIEFGPEDAAALRAAAPIVKQITNCAVDAVCEFLCFFTHAGGALVAAGPGGKVHVFPGGSG